MSSSLAQRSLFKALVARDGLTTRGQGLHGLTLQAKALAAAAASHEQPGDPVRVIVPTDAAMDGVVGDVRFFLGAIEGLSDSALGGLVLPLPSLQVDPYRALAPHMRVTSARARALLALASGQARVVVASATALLPRLPDPSALVARSLGVRTGGEVDPQSLAALLTDGGYDRHDPVEQHGEFCLRGGILDVYPPNELWPIRVEFIGDMVESIRRFDPDTQRSVETLDQFLAEGQTGRYDFAFIDADKSSYDAYYERMLKLVRPGGLIAIDNVLWFGRVTDPSDTSADTTALRALNTKIKGDTRVDTVLLPVADGIFMCRKR